MNVPTYVGMMLVMTGWDLKCSYSSSQTAAQSQT